MTPIDQATRVIRDCGFIVIATGAGMGVDSGLPDFRGDDGFWKAYPPFQKLGLSFYDLADPRWFREHPRQAWGFYGHRLNLYAKTKPNAGFDIIRRWIETKSNGGFAFTSNVDCHFQSAGFDQDNLVECHGSFSQLQCATPCSDQLWPAEAINVHVDESTMLAAEPLPKCPQCDGVARPNILMFGDGQWIGDRTQDQTGRYNSWLSKIPKGEIAVIEIGAGKAVPTVRYQSENLIRTKYAKLIRINPRESDGPDGTISIAAGGLETLQEIDSRLSNDELGKNQTAN